MICYEFPPTGGSGVQRSLKFAKYLPESGWLPIILAGEVGGGDAQCERDESLMSDFPAEGIIYRTRVLDPLRPARRLWRRDRGQKRGLRAAERPRESSARGLLRLARRIWHTWVYIPDECAGWLAPATLLALATIRHHEIEVVYSTSYPYTAHLVGYLASRAASKPWVADFRDAWTIDALYRHRGRIRYAIDRRLEMLMLKNADRVVVPSSQIRDNYVATYPSLDGSKIVTIMNGYDQDDFATATPPPVHNQKLVVTYAGRFDAVSHRLPQFLHAVHLFLQMHTELRSKLEVRFVGSYAEEDKRLTEELGLSEVVRWLGYVAHRQCLTHLREANVLLLTLRSKPGTESVPTGKIFEYIAARKPILAVVPHGAAADLVRGLGRGVVVGPDDIAAIADALYDLYRRHRDGVLSIDPSTPIQHFERKHLTGQLANVFAELVPASPGETLEP